MSGAQTVLQNVSDAPKSPRSQFWAIFYLRKKKFIFLATKSQYGPFKTI